MIDHRRFLDDRRREVLPYLGGPVVDGRDRRLRVSGPADAGWVDFEIAGRTAEAVGRAVRPDLSDLPAVHGHLLQDYLVHADARAEVLFLAADAEAPMFAPLTARRWPAGALLFEALDYETEAEETTRRAFEERRTLAGTSGIPSPLRAAFGYAIAMRLANERNVVVSPAELRLDVGRLAEGGDEVGGEVLARLEETRERQRRMAPPAPSLGSMTSVRLSDEDRIEDALAAAGGQVLAIHARGDVVEVRFLLRGERFSSIVHPDTLQVLDAGICLAGADREITIESLPSVILEGFTTGQIVMTSRA